jgi:hypothetical protein
MKNRTGTNFNFMRLRLLDFQTKTTLARTGTRTRSLILRPRSRRSILLRRPVFAAFVFEKIGKLRQHFVEKPCQPCSFKESAENEM